MSFTLGVTGEGLVVPGATPITGVSGVPDGSAVVLPGGTGVPVKQGKASNMVYYFFLDFLRLALCFVNDLFIAFTAKDSGLGGTPQPGTVKCKYSAFPWIFTVHAFTKKCFCSSYVHPMEERGRSAIFTHI